MNKLKVFPILVGFLSPLAFSQQLFDESFLDSLPTNIQDDLLKQSSMDQTAKDLNIPSPETRIMNLEQALSDAKRTLSRIEQDLLQDSLRDDGPLLRFGEKFFSSFQSTFLPVNEPNSNSSYVLDAGDIMTLQLIGKTNDTINLPIKRNGAINIPEFGDLNIAGLELAEAIEMTKQVISKTFIGVDAYLSLAELRDMNVMIVGNVENPGMYTLRGGSSPLSLISAAGGINKSGSYRVVDHKRNGEVINTIDLYSIFIEGDTSSLSQLRNGDSIVVRMSSTEVQISGGVANPAIYEMKDGETLEDLLLFSGFYTNLDLRNINIKRRNLSGDYELLKIDSENSNEQVLLHGDSVEVPFVLPKFRETRRVVISGEVDIPGTYFIDEKTRLSQLIKKAGGYTSEAYPLGGVFTRESAVSIEQSLKERSYNELIRFLVASQGGGSRSALSSDSLITFLSLLKEYQPTGRIITEFEISELERDPSLDRVIVGGDRIHIPAFNNQVYVYGEVLNPSAYNYDPDLSFNDYLDLSGGFSRSADENKIILISPNGVATSIKLGLLNSLTTNKQVLPGSLIYVPQYVGKIEGISLASAVAPIVSSFALSIASLNSINN